MGIRKEMACNNRAAINHIGIMGFLETICMTKESQIAVINAEINRELMDPAVGRALLATTFKGLNAVSMKMAIMEGMVRGFKFKDFLEKNVYAIPFKDGYALVTSIDRARKIGAKSGVVGIKKPQYVMDKFLPDKIVSCEVTVQKRVGGYVGDYTAEVFFDEYYKPGRNNWPSLWDTKPRTMISKVAEMHALRKACPEELSQAYTEEEFDADKAEPHEPMPSYEVKRIIPAADDDEQSEPIASARMADDEEKKEAPPDDALEHMFDDETPKKKK